MPAFREDPPVPVAGLERFRIALMCAKEPLDCHRTILVCRHLQNRGITIQHILADGQIENHSVAERRLLRLAGEERMLFEPNVTEEELLNRTYESRGRQIAYRMSAEGTSTMTETASPESKTPITLFTIGFTGKTAEQFFTILQESRHKLLIDIRLNNVSQLAGFTKRRDLQYFLKAIAGIEYEHNTELAHTSDILDAYKKRKMNWDEYEQVVSTLC